MSAVLLKLFDIFSKYIIISLFRSFMLSTAIYKILRFKSGDLQILFSDRFKIFNCVFFAGIKPYSVSSDNIFVFKEYLL